MLVCLGIVSYFWSGECDVIRDKFVAIELGMTDRDVERLLGCTAHTYSSVAATGDLPPGEFKVGYWLGQDVTIMVHFHDCEVVYKQLAPKTNDIERREHSAIWRWVRRVFGSWQEEKVAETIYSSCSGSATHLRVPCEVNGS